MQKSKAGYTLVELLLCVSILALLLYGLDLQGWARARETRLIESAMSDIVATISMARQAAIAESRMVTYCRSNDGLHCQGKWHEGSILFTDRNGDREINGDDRLLFRLKAVDTPGQLTFRSFQNQQYLQMTPFGMTNYQNGNFTFCPANGDATLARQVIVSMTGRTRYAKDGDGDGIIENSQGKAVDCD